MESIRELRETVFQGRRITVVRDTYRTGAGQRYVREIVLTPGAVVILPLLAGNRVCLVRNRRDAVGEVLLELPAGTAEPGEDPEQTARRELEEETGYRAREWKKLLDFYPSPGILSEHMHLFLARDLVEAEQNLDPGEQVEPVILGFAQALEGIERGEIHDAKTIVGLLYWERLIRTGRAAATW